MWTFLTLLFWLAVAVGVLALYGFIAGRYLQRDPEPDLVHFVVTSDGWRLGLSRYCPGQALAGAPPLLLCPGLALSGRIFDLGPDRSLARYLAQHGYDVWVLDWRGRGWSERPRLWGNRRYSWSFDDYLAFDLPAAVQAICAATGKTQALGVGFGLGGLLLLLGAGGAAAPHLAGVAALGSAAFFRRTAAQLPPWSLRLLGRVRLEALVRLAAPLVGRFFPGPLGVLQNRDAVEPALYRRALANAASSPSPRELRQLEDWLRDDQITAAGERSDHRPALARVTAPVLLVSGVRDPLAAPEAVELTGAALTGAERSTVQASRLQGMASNYGHLDLLIGANAARDIYPHLLRWLDAHAGLPTAPDDRPDPPHGELPWPAATPARTPDLRLGEPAATSGAAATSGPVLAPPPPAPDPSPAGTGRLFADEEAETAADQERDDLDWLDGDVPRVPRPDER